MPFNNDYTDEYNLSGTTPSNLLPNALSSATMPTGNRNTLFAQANNPLASNISDNVGVTPSTPTEPKPLPSTPLATQKPSFKDFFKNLGVDKKQALNMALLSAGFNMMSNAGRSYDRPVSTFGLLGEAGQQGMNTYQSALTNARQEQTNALRNALLQGQIEGIPQQQALLQAQVESIPLQQAHLEAQTKALENKPAGDLTPTGLAVKAASGDPIAIKAMELSRTGQTATPYSVFYQGQKQKYPEKTDYDISKDWIDYQKDINGQYKPSEYNTFYQGLKQDNPDITDSEISRKWVEYTQNKGLNTYQTVQTAGALRNEIKNNPYVKEFQDINTKFSVMEKALDESKVTGDLIATDQALITLFNKMTDPESVVRESEYARTPDDASLMNRLKGRIGKLQKGGAGLTNEDRQALYTMANKFYDVYSKNYDETVKNYKELAKASGIKENLIGIPYERKAEIKAKQPSRMVYNPATGEIE